MLSNPSRIASHPESISPAWRIQSEILILQRRGYDTKRHCRFEYVKNFEQPDNLLPNTWVVVRIDGRAFTKSETPDRLYGSTWLTGT